MWTSKRTARAAVLVATVVVIGRGLPAQQAPAPKPESPEAVIGVKAKLADSATMTKAEAELDRLRELLRPQAGEYATNIARIAWERDPWEAAVKAGLEGKPVIAYGLHNAGVTCGFG